MGAILSVCISIDRKRLLAHRANEVIICFSLYLIEMAVPPFHPAAVGAELLFLSASGLWDSFAAALTNRNACCRLSDNAAEVSALAETLYCIFG